MSYLVLARRWRPQRFADLVGQDVVVRTLKNALSSNSLAHAYLLTGIRGVGKTTIARLMAMSVNCAEQQDGEPCGLCDACVAIASGSHLDVQEIDAASHTGVDDMREILDGVRYPPVSLPYKVYIIDEAHMLSKSAFNALLKTLEEPPEQVLFILATTESDKLPITVRSRCQRFDLRRLGVQEVADYLAHVLEQEKVSAEVEGLLTIARAADGSVRDALSLTERVLAYANEHIKADDVRQTLGMIGPEVVQNISNAIAGGDAKQAVQLVRAAAMQGAAARSLLQALSEQWHQLACVMVDESLLDDVPSEQTQAWLQSAKTLWTAQALDMRYQVLVHGLRDLGLVDEQRGVEMIVMRLCHLHGLLHEAPNKASGGAVQHRAEPVRKVVKAPAAVAAMVKKSAVKEPLQQAQTVERAKPEPQPVAATATHARSYESWHEAVTAFAEQDPGVAAMLENVVCVSYAAGHVQLALDTHQKRAIVQQDRTNFEAWLGGEVRWDAALASGNVESITTVRARHAQEEQQQLEAYAKQDSAVKMLEEGMAGRLTTVEKTTPSEERS